LRSATTRGAGRIDRSGQDSAARLERGRQLRREKRMRAKGPAASIGDFGEGLPHAWIIVRGRAKCKRKEKCRSAARNQVSVG
jgi:hypothetical protein